MDTENPVTNNGDAAIIETGQNTKRRLIMAPAVTGEDELAIRKKGDDVCQARGGDLLAEGDENVSQSLATPQKNQNKKKLKACDGGAVDNGISNNVNGSAAPKEGDRREQ